MPGYRRFLFCEVKSVPRFRTFERECHDHASELSKEKAFLGQTMPEKVPEPSDTPVNVPEVGRGGMVTPVSLVVPVDG